MYQTTGHETVAHHISKTLEFGEKYLLQVLLSILFSMFGNVIKCSLSYEIYNFKKPEIQIYHF